MIITFLDGSKKEFEVGSSALDIANSISSSLAKKSIFALVNGEEYDLTRPILADATLELKMKEDAINVLNHSCAHLLASAIKRLYPNAMFGVGPSIEEGFYYDVNLGDVKITEADLPKLEKEMKHIVSQNVKFERKEVSKQEALEVFKDDKYKVELINELPEDAVIGFSKPISRKNLYILLPRFLAVWTCPSSELVSVGLLGSKSIIR